MPVAVYMKDMLEPVEIDEEITGLLNALNIASSKGMSFMVMDSPDGSHVVLNMANINLAREEIG